MFKETNNKLWICALCAYKLEEVEATHKPYDFHVTLAYMYYIVVSKVFSILRKTSLKFTICLKRSEGEDFGMFFHLVASTCMYNR